MQEPQARKKGDHPIQPVMLGALDDNRFHVGTASLDSNRDIGQQGGGEGTISLSRQQGFGKGAGQMRAQQRIYKKGRYPVLYIICVQRAVSRLAGKAPAAH